MLPKNDCKGCEGRDRIIQSLSKRVDDLPDTEWLLALDATLAEGDIFTAREAVAAAIAVVERQEERRDPLIQTEWQDWQRLHRGMEGL